MARAVKGGPRQAGFEGGQMPITRRIPKRGFTNPFRVESQVVSLGARRASPSGEVTRRRWPAPASSQHAVRLRSLATASCAGLVRARA